MEANESTIVIGKDDPLATAWLARTKKADEYYKQWSDKFKADTMEEYYYGFQFADGSNAPIKGYERYVTNRIFSILEIKKPSVLFQELAYRIKPKPGAGEWNFEHSAKKAQMREDILNTIVSDEEIGFAEDFEACVVDAYFRFAVMEVGYSADWIDNPNAGKPILKSDNTPYLDPDAEAGKDNIIREPEEIPLQERVYCKRIMPWRFRVGGFDGMRIKNCSWIGYYDFVRVEDLKADKNLKNTDKIKYVGGRSADFSGSENDPLNAENDGMLKSGDLIKIWRIWDLRAKKKYIFCASENITLQDKTFKDCPISALKFVNKLRGWYPIPVVFNWKGPQDELNEAREQQRVHRRRSRRIFLYKEGTFEDDQEMDKIESGPDMTFAKVTSNPKEAIAALENAPLDSIVGQDLQLSDADLNKISGTTMEDQGIGDRTTATQATIVNQASSLRENRARALVARFAKEIGRQILSVVRDNFTEDFWAKIKTDRFSDSFLGEFKEAQEEWKQYKASDIDGDDFQVDISIDSVSPIENGAQKQAFIEFLDTLTKFPFIAFDPILVREAAYRCNYRNERVIANMAKMAQLAHLGQLAQAEASVVQLTGQTGSAKGPVDARLQQMQTPSPEEVTSQVTAQLPVS